MLDRFIIFLLKVTASAFFVVVLIVCICSGLILRFMKWKQRKKKRTRSVGSHHQHYNQESHSQLRSGHLSQSLSHIHIHQSHHSHPNQHQLEGYLVETAETGSTAIGSRKVTPEEDVPPVYDFPPAYHTLFPQKDQILFLNESGLSRLTGDDRGNLPTFFNQDQRDFTLDVDSGPTHSNI